MHIEYLHTCTITVCTFAYVAIKDRIQDNSHYGIHHNLTKKCWVMLDFVF